MGSHSSNMVELALKALLIITLGQHFIMGHRVDRSLESDEESLFAPGGSNLQMLFNEADTNNDQRLTFDECLKKWSQTHLSAFKRADSNNDTFLSFDEFKQPPRKTATQPRQLQLQQLRLYQKLQP